VGRDKGEGRGKGGKMTQTLYAHMNKRDKNIRKAYIFKPKKKRLKGLNTPF
jgi:hypothetical protein